jgi:hypothetical protein
MTTYLLEYTFAHLRYVKPAVSLCLVLRERLLHLMSDPVADRALRWTCRSGLRRLA